MIFYFVLQFPRVGTHFAMHSPINLPSFFLGQRSERALSLYLLHAELQLGKLKLHLNKFSEKRWALSKQYILQRTDERTRNLMIRANKGVKIFVVANLISIDDLPIDLQDNNKKSIRRRIHKRLFCFSLYCGFIIRTFPFFNLRFL